MKLDLTAVERKARGCRLCSLWKKRKNVAFGEGSEKAGIFFIGEAPGRMEDEKGRPFCGPAGKILDGLLEHAGLKRKDVYITSVVKCRPPGNREPTKREIAACSPYLNEQISAIKPRMVCPLGNVAARYVMGEYGIPFEGIGKAHGKTFAANAAFGEITIVPLYHPAVLLHGLNVRKEMEKDFGRLKRILTGMR